VQAHEGKVWARSELGKGTSFVVRLRRMDHEAVAASDTSSAAEPTAVPTSEAALAGALGGRVGNILVCDDERSICELLDIALRRDGHKVETVTSGDAARRKIDSALFDVIVTDIKCPASTAWKSSATPIRSRPNPP